MTSVFDCYYAKYHTKNHPKLSRTQKKTHRCSKTAGQDAMASTLPSLPIRNTDIQNTETVH